MKPIVATASAVIDSTPGSVWRALTEPALIAKYMFGARVESDFKPGSPITWSGEWQGKPYQDRGTILRAEPERLLEFTHYSPLSGPDVPANHHTVSMRLTPQGSTVVLDLSQDNNADETARAHSAKNWATALDGLVRVVTGLQPP